MFRLTRWRKAQTPTEPGDTANNTTNDAKAARPRRRWNLGILSDAQTDEVPGSVILLSKRNEPLGLQHVHARTSASSLPPVYGPTQSTSREPDRSFHSVLKDKKRTKDGRFILDPQPEESANDPLNWRQVRRDLALLSLSFYCMIGGGMTPVLAAGFNDVARTYNVSIPQVALTTGLYMLGLGIGSVVASPTAILWGKRPVYLVAIFLFTLASIWCALSPSYASLVVARIAQGFAVSPVECLPSATIAEIFFLHERAYRLGIYTLLLLGGKNIIPLVSAVIVQSLGWRWVFWITAIVVGFCFFLIFCFVPETFWDRTPRPARRHTRDSSQSPGENYSHFRFPSRHTRNATNTLDPLPTSSVTTNTVEPAHVAFVDNHESHSTDLGTHGVDHSRHTDDNSLDRRDQSTKHTQPLESTRHDFVPLVEKDPVSDPEKQGSYLGNQLPSPTQLSAQADHNSECLTIHYTDYYRSAPPKSYRQSLKPWNGRLVKDTWFRVMIRPFVLFAYPAVLWSSLVYALAVGWLIVLSESVAHIYEDTSYNFTPLQVGLVYISPFVGGVLGTAVAGRVSDLLVRYMARKNDGVYEPEFRLLMVLPITVSTVIGLMGFGWSAEERDKWIVPTVFFGVISFGCSLASTTAITFVVDSYRAFAGEALVTLNFSKNVLHGFIFSLFFPHWLQSSGSKRTFLVIGGIQLACMLLSIPMYVYGKRARMWTVRQDLMARF